MMSRSESEGQTGSSSETEDTGPGTYFEDATEEWADLEEQRGELAMRQEALRRLDERVAKIDCDIGGASLEISDNGIIDVSTPTPEMGEEVTQLVHGYSWPKKFDIGYDTRSQCVTWSLKTDCETLVEDHQRITGQSMHLQLEHEDGSRTAYFGICDFQTEGEQTRIAFHSDVNLNGDECYRSEDGEVVSAVSESGYNEEGAYETIGDLATDDDVDVVVAVTNNYPWVAAAARQLEQEEDFDVEFEFIK